MASVTVSGNFVEHNDHHGYLAHIQENEKNIDLMVFVPIDENDPLDGFNTLQAIGSQIASIIIESMERQLNDKPTAE